MYQKKKLFLQHQKNKNSSEISWAVKGDLDKEEPCKGWKMVAIGPQLMKVLHPF